MSKKEPCAHCWHYIGGYSNGMGSAGEDDDRCCFCGHRRKRPWVSVLDPKHGPHCPENIKSYTE